MPKLPSVKWDEANGVWYSRAYLGTNASTGERMRKRVSFHAETEAEAQEQSDTFWENFILIAGRSIDGTVRAWMESYLLFVKETRSPNTHRTYKSHLANRFTDAFLAKQLLEVTKSDVVSWMESQKGMSASTRRNAYQFLLGTFTFALQAMDESGVNALNVVKEAPMKIPSARMSAFPASKSDVAALLQYKCNTPKDRMLSMAIALSASTGMRAGEICALMPDQVRLDLFTPTIYVIGSVTEATKPISIGPTKSKRTRSIAVGPSTSAALASHVAWKDSVFGRYAPIITVSGKLLRPSMLSRMFAARRDELGLDQALTFHSLRHYAATLMLHSNTPVAMVSSRLGHASQSTTMNIYSHVMVGDDAMAAGVTDIDMSFGGE